jgi:hypothetical protein
MQPMRSNYVLCLLAARTAYIADQGRSGPRRGQ